MLWHILWKNKNTFSLTFTIGFSIISILWQRNPLAMGMNTLGKLGDRVSGAMNASLKAPGVLFVELDKYTELQKKYDAALLKLEHNKLENDKFDTLKRENSLLREQLNFPQHTENPELKAEILAIRINNISPRIIINKGSNDGVKAFMPVITRSYDQQNQIIRAVVGIVASVDSSTSIIQPINHPQFKLGVRIPTTGQWAILSGNSGRLSEVKLTYVSADGSPDRATHSESHIDILKKSTVITSGAGGIFPPGIPVGAIKRDGGREGEFRSAYVRTFADVSSLDYVTIILKEPASWVHRLNEDVKWDEHLMTEFGPAVYPDDDEKEPETHHERKPEPVNTATEQPQEENSTDTPEEIEVQQTPPPQDKPEEKKPEKQEQAPPRRLQNINVNSPGRN